MDNKNKKKGFAFMLTKDKIKECSRFSTEEKLEWLEEVNKLISDFLPMEKLDKWKRFIGN